MPTLPVAGTINGTATRDGSTNTRLVAVADLTHADRGARARVTGTTELRLGPGVEPTSPTARVSPAGELTYTSGGARRAGGGGRAPWVNADLRLHPLSLVTVGRFAPAVGLRGTATGPIRVTGSLANLQVRAPLTFSDGGGLDVRGTLDLASAEKGYDLSAVARVFNANLIVAKAPSTSLTLTATAEGRGFDPATMNARIAADVQTSSYNEIPLDSARLRLAIGGGLARLDSSAVLAPSARALLNGTFGLTEGREGTLVYTVQVDSLAAFNRFLPAADTGVVAPRPRQAAIARARVRADSAKAADAVAVERAATGRSSIAAETEAKAKSGVADTLVAVRKDSLAGTVYAAGIVRGGVARFDVRGRAATEGVVAYGSAARHARIEYGLVGGGTPAMAVAAGAQLDSASVSGFAIDTIDTRVTWRSGGTGTVALVLRQQGGEEYSANAEYALSLDRNEVRWTDLGLRFSDTRWTATRPGAVRWGPRGIEVEQLDLRNGPSGRIYVNGLLPTSGRGDLQATIDNFEVADLAALAQSDLQLRGKISLGLNFEGTTSDPTFRGAIGVRDGNYRGSTLPELHARFGYGAQRLEAHAEMSRSDGGATFLTADGSLPVNLALAGVTGPRLAPDSPLEVNVKADSLPLDLIPRFTDAVANVRGLARGDVRVRGTVNAPDLAGNVTLERAQAKLVPLGITLRDMAGTLHLAGDTVVIDSIVGRSRGSLLVRGGLGVRSFASPSFDLFVVANDLRVLDNDQGEIELDAGLRLSGPFDSAYVTGAVNDIHGVYYLPESEGKQVINAGDPAVFSVVDTAVAANRELLPGQSPLLAGLRADVDVEVSRDTWVRRSDANVEVFSDGPLRVHVDRRAQALTLTGVVSTERGEYEFLGKRFQIRRGSANFIGSPDLNPILQITAEQPVQLAGQQTFNIQVIIGGTLDNPRITLQSDRQPPISQSDLLSYLAFSRSSSSLIPFQGQGQGTSVTSPSASGGTIIGSTAQFATTRLAAVALGVAVEQLESGAARSLGADVLNITPAEVNSDLFQGRTLNFLRQTQIEYGRYFASSRLYVALQGTPAPVVPGAVVQYRANAGWRYELSFTPRYILTDPALGPTATDKAPPNVGVPGVSVVREWRF
jgi:translocation and assembly module TamB